MHGMDVDIDMGGFMGNLTSHTPRRGLTVATAAALLLMWASTPAGAQELSAEPAVASTSTPVPAQAAAQGVALAELQPNAPESYQVKAGDTLWGIAKMYLKRPWQWPQLWGMNQQAIANPHRIYPGQTLYLLQESQTARLGTHAPGAVLLPSGEPPTVRLSPRTRTQGLAELALPTLRPHLIEPFLVQPLVVDSDTLLQAPRIVATTEERVVMGSGDRAYARGDASSPLVREPGEPRHFQIYRNAIALKDPLTGAVLGYEAQYLGKAELIQGERLEEFDDGKGATAAEYVPAILTITNVKEEVRAGDRLLPVPERSFTSYIPRAPHLPIDARIVSLYGSNKVQFAGHNQVVAINKGTQDSLEPGHVLQILTRGERIVDTTGAERSTIKLPSERNGLAMVFRTFDRVSYALILQLDLAVRVGDRLTNPN